jgi:hypothetical protein
MASIWSRSRSRLSRLAVCCVEATTKVRHRPSALPWDPDARCHLVVKLLDLLLVVGLNGCKFLCQLRRSEAW